MKNIVLGIILFLATTSAFSQNEVFKFTYMGNDIEIKMERNNVDDFDIHITNLNNDGISKKITLPSDTSLSYFIETVYNRLDGLIENYNFSINSELTMTLPKNAVGYNDFIDKFQSLSEEEFIKFIKSKTSYTEKKLTFSNYISNLPADGKTLFDGSNVFLFKTEEGSNAILLKENGIKILDISDESTFYKSFYDIKKEDGELIKLLFPTSQVNLITSNSLSANDRNNLEDFYKKNIGKDDYEFVKNVSVFDAESSKDYEVSIKPNLDKKFFNIRICLVSPLKCKTTSKFGLNIEYEEFERLFTNFMKTDFEETRFDKYDYRTIYDYCKKFNKEAVAKEVSNEFKDTISNLLKKIEDLEPQYSGILKLNETPVRVYKSKNDKPEKDVFFIPKYATVRFFNNKAKDIEVVGTYRNKDATENREFVVRNFHYSIPMRGFINSTKFIAISPNDDDADQYLLNYNDLFHYYPSERTFNYSVRNNDYRIKAGDSVKVEQRRLADYFTAVIFSDFLGLNSENANSLLVAEGRLKVPLWISNASIWSAFSAVRADINATIYNGFDDSSRFITPANAPEGVSTAELTSLEVNIFDYIKFNNINAGIGLDVVNLEIKPLSAEWSFGYGIRYYRAGVKYDIQKTDADEERKYQLNALTHEISTNFEIRPELNFGADINLGFNWINARGALKDIPIVYTKNSNMDDKSVLRMQLNLYSKIDPRNSNDGIYARLGGFYHLGSKDFYPQIMVGYATNLSSFVNKFKKD